MGVELCGLTQGMFGWRIARPVTNSRTRSRRRIVAHRRFEMREYHGSIPASPPPIAGTQSTIQPPGASGSIPIKSGGPSGYPPSAARPPRPPGMRVPPPFPEYLFSPTGGRGREKKSGGTFFPAFPIVFFPPGPHIPLSPLGLAAFRSPCRRRSGGTGERRERPPLFGGSCGTVPPRPRTASGAVPPSPPGGVAPVLFIPAGRRRSGDMGKMEVTGIEQSVGVSLISE